MRRAHLLTRTLILIAALLAIQLPRAFAEPQHPVPKGKPSTPFGQIRSAEARGEISGDDSLYYRVMALYAPDELPARFRAQGRDKCATGLLAELEARWQQLPSDNKKALSRWPVAAAARGLAAADSRPGFSGLEQTVATPHFLIHYATAGVDGVALTDLNFNGVPDYVDATAQAMEYSRFVEVESLGWLEPPSDGPVDPAGPLYDVYIKYVPVDGLTYPEDIKGDNEHSLARIEPFARYSYIILNSKLTVEGLQVAAAHEYTHAIQFGYNAATEGFDARRWLMEGTATWIEDQVYDEVDDNIGYLPVLFAHPDRSLASVENSYASWLFFEYLAEHFGGQSPMRAIWDYAVPLQGDYSFDAIQQVLASQGASFAQAFFGFSVANLTLLPCELSPSPYCYRDALLYLDQAGYPLVEGQTAANSGERIYAPVDGVEDASADYVNVVSRAALVAASGYAPPGVSGLQGAWVARKGLAVDVLPFEMSANPEPPAAQIKPQDYDALYVVVANLRAAYVVVANLRAAGEVPQVSGYGLAFTVLDASTPTPTPTRMSTATPMPTLTPSPTPEPRRLYLPVIARYDSCLTAAEGPCPTPVPARRSAPG